MEVQFWGVRGSLPAPLTPTQIQTKIAAVVQRISSKDIESEDARERFLSTLPKWMYGTIGGNTACVELTTDEGDEFIFDAGTGLRVLGSKLAVTKTKVCHIFLSHYHWDHIQGLPFFGPAYNPNFEMQFYTTFPASKRLLEKQMSLPYFPVQMDTSFTKKIFFHTIKARVPFKVGNAIVEVKKMSHPGKSYSYSVKENGKCFIYATDVELSQKDFDDTAENASFFEGADSLVLDAQYTIEEAVQKENWGHSAFCYAIDFAAKWHIRNVYLFHHEPAYDDRKIYSILQAAQWYADYSGIKNLSVYLATEGLCVTI